MSLKLSFLAMALLVFAPFAHADQVVLNSNPGTGEQYWTVPSNFNPTENTLSCIGAEAGTIRKNRLQTSTSFLAIPLPMLLVMTRAPRLIVLPTSVTKRHRPLQYVVQPLVRHQ
jgi:hypothetical protein